MSRILKELYERLSGINLVRQKVSDLRREIDRLADTVLDHEKRLIRMETLQTMSQQPIRPAKLPPPDHDDSG
jgi:hypothetical protein